MIEVTSHRRVVTGFTLGTSVVAVAVDSRLPASDTLLVGPSQTDDEYKKT